jgi:acyl-CoA synthetase (AMP-forming)/AMP-acid ligase II
MNIRASCGSSTAMPMTTTGKIIRARLREMAEAEARADALHGAAENHAKGPAHER